MDQAEQIRRNTDDIQALTNAVTKLAAMQEVGAERRKDDADTLKRVADGLSGLNERLNATASMAGDLKSVAEKVGELKEDGRIMRHDLNTALNSLAAIPVLGEKITDNAKDIVELKANVSAIMSWKDKRDGALGLINALWGVLGTAIVGGIGWIIYIVYETKKSGGTISGE